MLAGKGVKRRRLSPDLEDTPQTKRTDLNAKNAWRRGDGFTDSAPIKVDGPHFTRPSFATPARPQSRGGTSLFTYDRPSSSSNNDFQDQTPQSTQRPRFLPTTQSPHHTSSSSFERPQTPSSSLTRPRFTNQPNNTQPLSSESLDYSQTTTSPLGNIHPRNEGQNTSPLKQINNPDPWLISTTFSPRKLKNRFTQSGWASIVRRWIVEAAYSTTPSTSTSISSSSSLSRRPKDPGILIRVTKTTSQPPTKIPTKARYRHRQGNVHIIRGVIMHDSNTNILETGKEKDPEEEVNILLSHTPTTHNELDAHEPSLSNTQIQISGLQGKTIRLNAPVERLDLRLPKSSSPSLVHGTNTNTNTDTGSGAGTIAEDNKGADDGTQDDSQGLWLICVGSFEILPT